MFSFDDKDFDNKKLAIGMILILLLQLLLAFLNRTYFMSAESLPIIRSKEDFYLQIGWLVLAHFIIALYFNLYFATVYKGNGPLEGMKWGAIIGFLFLGVLLTVYSHLQIMDEMSWIFFKELLLAIIGPAIGGLLLSFVYGKRDLTN